MFLEFNKDIDLGFSKLSSDDGKIPIRVRPKSRLFVVLILLRLGRHISAGF